MAEAQEPMGPPENGQGMGRQMGPGGQRMMGPRIPNGGPGILMIPEVQTELKLSDSQIVKIKKILPQPPQARQGARGEVPWGPGGPDGQAGPQFGSAGQGSPRGAQLGPQAMKKLEAQVKGILSAAQFERYQQISLQLAGPRAFQIPYIQDKLDLSDEQIEKIRAATPRGQQGGPQGSPQGGPVGGLRNRGQEVGPAGAGRRNGVGQRDQRAEAMERIFAILTPEQNSKFKAMLGKPFELKRQGRPAGGPPNGEPPAGGPPPEEDN